jgi:hypothetical protein
MFFQETIQVNYSEASALRCNVTSQASTSGCDQQ